MTAEEVPGYIKLTVLDNGIGIPAAEQQEDLQPLLPGGEAPDAAARGHGHRALLRQGDGGMHGGKISVESVEEKGSRFTVLIPLNAAQASAAQKVFLSNACPQAGAGV